MMHLLAGAHAHILAILIAVPVALIVTGILFFCWRRTFLQKDAMPGADETARADKLSNALMDDFAHRGHEWDLGRHLLLALLLLGSYLRNGLTVVGLAIVFGVVLTGSHALLMAL